MTAADFIESGNDFLNSGDIDKAIEEYTQAIRLEPNDVNAYMSRGDAYRKKYDNNNENEDYGFDNESKQQQIDNLNKAITDFTQVLHFVPDSISAYIKRGCAYIKKSHYDNDFHEFVLDEEEIHRQSVDLDKAIADLTYAIQLDPNNTDTYINRGDAYSSYKDYDNAIKDYTQAIKINPNDINAYHKRGYTFSVDLKDYDSAISDYTQIINVDSNNARAYIGRGAAYFNKNDYADALKDYTQAIKIDPNNRNAYYLRSLVYYNREDYDNVIADYTQILNLEPNNTHYYIKRGTIYKEKDDYNNAIADYTQAIKIDPNNAEAYIERGDVYYFKKDYDTAIANYTQAIKCTPNIFNSSYCYRNAYYYRGEAYREKGDYDNAIADYTQVINIDPNDIAAYINRGVTYDEKNDCDNAIADYNKAFKLDSNENEPNNESVAFLPIKFDCILSLDDMAIQKVLRETDSKTFTIEIKGEEGKNQNKVFINMSEMVVAMLKEGTEYFGHIRKNDMNETREKILNVIRRLVQTGEIEIAKEQPSNGRIQE